MLRVVERGDVRVWRGRLSRAEHAECRVREDLGGAVKREVGVGGRGRHPVGEEGVCVVCVCVCEREKLRRANFGRKERRQGQAGSNLFYLHILVFFLDTSISPHSAQV